MIVVRYFAAIKEKIGKDQDLFEIESGGTTLQKILDRIADRYPHVRSVLSSKNFLFAVNQEMSSPETELKDDDEIAILPPLSGG